MSSSGEAANNDITSASSVEDATVVCNLELQQIAPNSAFRKNQKPLVDFLSSNVRGQLASLKPVSSSHCNFCTSVSYTAFPLDTSKCVFL